MDRIQDFIQTNKTIVLGMFIVALLYFFYKYRETSNDSVIPDEHRQPVVDYKDISANNSPYPAPSPKQQQQQQQPTPDGRRLVFFYANWCGHCQKMKPEWDKLVQKYNQTYQLEQYEADEHKDIMKKEQIEGFPTIKLYKADGTSHEYRGDRSFESLEKFLIH